MRIESITINSSGLQVPAIEIAPVGPIGAAVLVHGYGGCKEEMLGLALHVAEHCLAAFCIDLRGHGENPLPFDAGVLEDLEAAIRHARGFGRVASIGHSLGGRLSLESSADLRIGISPPLEATYGPRTQEMLEKLRGQRVRVESPDTIFKLLAGLPRWNGRDDPRTMIIYGSKDIREIVASCDQLRCSMKNVVMVEGARHNETHLLQRTYEAISERLDGEFAGARAAFPISETGAELKGHLGTMPQQITH